MMGQLGTTELVLILAVVVLLFGVGRVSRIGGEMGSAIREFRRGLKGNEEETAESKPETTTKS
ncbi:MAG: twin-arginine translocase TatA/TatE family subunit [Chloroflexota bacterium]|jgi:sec-independent protein translocase protein TatA|nr:twin-arginine translocase TatA/TatE family subunit [Anaerolineae bacterium]HMM28525.1 twin-arginine translocase TatA/TatE family subunit [Aggregatilineaceae bacterium]